MSQSFSSDDPINGGFANPPASLPLGVSFADRVGIREIDYSTATRIYEAHHSYLPSARSGWHYGVYLDEQLVGAITFDAWPSQSKIRGYPSSEIREVARVCIANDTPNLASCAMSKAQDKFLDERGDGIDLLVTYVREDYLGSMFKALRGKGWETDGYSEKRTASYGNKTETYSMDSYGKERWVCEV